MPRKRSDPAALRSSETATLAADRQGTYGSVVIDEETVPRLARRVRLRADPARGGHVLLFPEGVLVLNPTAAEVLYLVDGARTLPQIAVALAARHGAPDASVVLGDVRELLGRLGARGFVEGLGATP